MIDINEVRQKAQEFFLGRDHVVAVGISSIPGRRIAIFLDQDAPKTKHETENWAMQYSTKIDFFVVGRPVVAVIPPRKK